MVTHEDYASIMEEPIGGENYGRTAPIDPETDGRWVPLDTATAQAAEFMREGGFSIVDTSYGNGLGRAYGSTDMGMSAHRGVLDADEFIDHDVLKPLVEEALGFTYEEISSAYREGRPSNDSRQLRDKIDARLLALSRSGGNMLALAKVFGWTVEPSDDGGGPSCRMMERAVARARQTGGTL